MLYLQTLAYQHGGISVSLGILPSSIKSSTRNDINSLGGYSGLLGQKANDAGVDEMFEGDLKTGVLYG